MASKLQEYLAAGKAAGYAPSLLVHNRTGSVAEQFAAATPGVSVMPSLAEVAAAAPAVVFCMLSNDAATDAMLSGFLSARGRQDDGPLFGEKGDTLVAMEPSLRLFFSTPLPPPSLLPLQ